MQQISLRYGTESVPFHLPDHAEWISVADPAPLVTPARFRERLAQHLGRLDLPGAAGSGIAVVVADKTRLCGYADYLPVLLEMLQEYGVAPERIRIYIAYGTHARQSKAVSRLAYGKAFDHYRFIHHDAADSALFVPRGTTTRGTPVMIRRDILNAGCRITFGAVSHHYFAGFGGGRKLIFPGLGHTPAIYCNHALFLDRATRTLAAGCRPGILDGNPLAEDLAEVESRCPAELAIHGILDSTGRVCDLLAGSGRAHFRAACAIHARHCEKATDQRYDRVIASCGGHPKDINFIQAHKALHNAAAFVRDGGELILLAACPDQIGSRTFLPWFGLGGMQAAFDALTAQYEGNGGTALAMMAKTRRIRIALVTELAAAHIRTIGAAHITMGEAMARMAAPGGTIAAIDNASLTVLQADRPALLS